MGDGWLFTAAAFLLAVYLLGALVGSW